MANSLNYTEKRQKSRAEFIVVIIVISLIMTLLIELFFSQQEKITDTIFVGLAQSFTSKVNVVHSKWLMDEQPLTVALYSLNDKEKQHVNVNQFGWIDSKYKGWPCQDIWQQTLLMPLKVVKSPVTAVEIKNKMIKNGRLCRYSLANGQSFDYRSDTGKVKQVN